MKRNNNRETLEDCLFLESLGFTINHEKSNVSIGYFEFDLSATEMTPQAIIKTVMEEMYKRGIITGKRSIQEKLRELINCKRDSDYDETI